VEQEIRVRGKAWVCCVLSTPEEIRALSPFVHASARNDVLRSPEFFLKSVTMGWQPRVVLVRDEAGPAGVVYAKERLICGCRLGVMYADLTWGSAPFGDPENLEETFRAAIEALLAFPGARGVRLRILPGSPESQVIRKLTAGRSLDVHFTRIRDHASLPLPDSYEKLLKSFGSTTRHNFRYYRRRFEAAGHNYLDNLSLEELRSACMYLLPRCTIPGQPGAVERLLDMVATAKEILAVGLKHRNGAWLSAIGGVYRPGAGVLLMQLSDDKGFPRDSLSVVLRGYLMEKLIRRGEEYFTIWGGTAPPLSRYVKYIPTLGVHLDLPRWTWKFARQIVEATGPWLPKRLRQDARWIAPFRKRLP
jgi:hypothetical protein